MVLAEFLGPDLVIVIVVLLVLAFAGPRLARNLGTAKKEFEKSLKSDPKNPEDSSGQ
jgi:Sec-independent protein translocase protein TatA